MRLTAYLPTGTAAARRGFTLIELLVVIAIIAILMALTAGAAAKMLGVQTTSNTKYTIRKVDAATQDQWRKAVRQADQNSRSAAAVGPVGYALIQQMAGNSGNLIEDQKRFKAIYMAYFLKQQFPQSFAEVLLCTPNPSGDPRYFNPLGPNQAYYTKLTTLGVAPNDPPQPGESSVCLLMALEKSIGGAGRVADVFGASSVKVQNYPTLPIAAGGTIPMDTLEDAWATPIEFYRWTTLSGDVDALAPVSPSVIRNPLDPDGKLIDAAWYVGNYNTVNNNPTLWATNAKYPPTGTGPRQLFEASAYSLTNPFAVNAQTNPLGIYAYYLVPIIVSAGPDQNLGLSYYYMQQGAGSTDNIYNYQIKQE